MTKTKRLTAFSALWTLFWAGPLVAQKSVDSPTRREPTEPDTPSYSEPFLPAYPMEERQVVDAPFSATFSAKVPAEGYDYVLQYWRRSDGSTVRRYPLPQVPAPFSPIVTEISDYSVQKSVTFLSVNGVVDPTIGVVENKIAPGVIRRHGDQRIAVSWTVVESEDSTLIPEVDERPCKRLLLEPSSGSKSLEVWISNDLEIVLKEQLREKGELRHEYVAVSIDRGDPPAAVFEVPHRPSP